MPAPRDKRFTMSIKHRSSAVGFRLALDIDDPVTQLLIEPVERAPDSEIGPR